MAGADRWCSKRCERAGRPGGLSGPTEGASAANITTSDMVAPARDRRSRGNLGHLGLRPLPPRWRRRLERCLHRLTAHERSPSGAARHTVARRSEDAGGGAADPLAHVRSCAGGERGSNLRSGSTTWPDLRVVCDRRASGRHFDPEARDPRFSRREQRLVRKPSAMSHNPRPRSGQRRESGKNGSSRCLDHGRRLARPAGQLRDRPDDVRCRALAGEKRCTRGRYYLISVPGRWLLAMMRPSRHLQFRG